MELARQQAFEMKDKLIRDFQEIKNNFPDNFPDDFPKPKHVKQPNGTYKMIPEPTTSSWRTDQQGEEWLQKVDTFLDHLTGAIEDTDVSLEDISDEIYILVKKVSRDGSEANVDIATCSKEAFVVHMVRECLYAEELSIVCAKNWTQFAKIYAKYVMSASLTN